MSRPISVCKFAIPLLLSFFSSADAVITVDAQADYSAGLNIIETTVFKNCSQTVGTALFIGEKGKAQLEKGATMTAHGAAEIYLWVPIADVLAYKPLPTLSSKFVLKGGVEQLILESGVVSHYVVPATDYNALSDEQRAGKETLFVTTTPVTFGGTQYYKVTSKTPGTKVDAADNQGTAELLTKYDNLDTVKPALLPEQGWTAGSAEATAIDPSLDVAPPARRALLDLTTINAQATDSTAVTLPAIEVTTADTQYVHTVFQSISGTGKDYTGVNTNLVQPITASTGSTLTFTADNSWFDGVAAISGGGTVVIDENGKMFGGAVDVSGGTTLEWHGGALDKENVPDISLTGATLKFALPTTGVNKIFSFYGTLAGDPTSTLEVAKGTVFWKGNGSGFQGTIFVEVGGELIVRTDGDHSGQLGGVIAAKVNGGEVSIRTSEGLSPITIANGTTLRLREDHGSTSATSTDKVNKLTITGGAAAEIDLSHAEFHDTKIQGTMTLNVGESAAFDNLHVEGGTLKIRGEGMRGVTMHGTVEFGSALDTMNGRIDDIGNATNVNPHDDDWMFETNIQTVLKVTEGHNMGYLLDIDPATNKADRITANSVQFSPGSFLAIEDYKPLSFATKPVHTMQILKLTDAGARYIPIRIDTDKEFEGANGMYRLYAEGPDGYITYRTVDGRLIYMHRAGLGTNIVDIHRNVFGQKAKSGSQMWANVTYSNKKMKIDTEEVESIGRQVVVGWDFAERQILQNSTLTPTIFAAYSSRDTKNVSERADQYDHVFGGKVEYGFGKLTVAAVGSYNYMKTSARDNDEAGSLKAHIFTGSLLGSYDFEIGKKFTITPKVVVDLSEARTTKKRADSSKTMFDVSPSLKFGYDFEFCKAGFEAMYTKQVSGFMKKKHQLEYRLNLCKDFGKISVSLEGAKSFGGLGRGYAIGLRLAGKI